MLTQPDRYNVKVRRSLPDLDAIEDVTIKDLSKPQDYGLGKLMSR